MFADTHIRELNRLLTRDDTKGILIPDYGPNAGGQSSVTVIKGSAGTGKSVLSAILAKNLNGQTVGTGESARNLISIYFSFSQPLQGIIQYLERILLPTDPTKLPIVLSENYGRQARQEEWSEIQEIITLRDLFVNSDQLCPTRGVLVDHIRNAVKSTMFFHGGGSLHESIGLTENDTLVQPLIIIDPINTFFGSQQSRKSVSNALGSFRNNGIPVILVLESDRYLMNADAKMARYIEYEADLVIELSEETEGYYARFLEVSKSRNAQENFGKHVYRIESPNSHALRDVPSSWQHQHPGFMIFPSIHQRISEWRGFPSVRHCHSGMSHFDNILNEGSAGVEPNLESNGFAVITGPGDSHKLSLSFNLLVGALIKHTHDSECCALMLSLGEDETIQIPRIALATEALQDGPTPSYRLNNGDIINEFRLRGHDTIGGAQGNVPHSARQKVILTRWGPDDDNLDFKKLIVATLRPGNLRVEEFLWIISSLVEELKPTRLLLSNTAHLKSRFPALYAETMLFTALASLCRTRGVMFIVNDVAGGGSDQTLTYALQQDADYVIRLGPCHDQNITAPLEANICGRAAISPGQGLRFAEMTISNRRGKNYFVMEHYVSVVPVPSRGRNELSIMNRPL